MPTPPTSDPLSRLTLSDVLPTEQHAAYLEHVSRLDAERTVAGLIALVHDVAELHPEYVKADLRLRVGWVWRAEETCGHWLRYAEGTPEKASGRTLRRFIRALRVGFGIGESNGGRPRKPPAGVIEDREGIAQLKCETARCRRRSHDRRATCATEPTGSTSSVIG